MMALTVFSAVLLLLCVPLAQAWLAKHSLSPAGRLCLRRACLPQSLPLPASLPESVPDALTHTDTHTLTHTHAETERETERESAAAIRARERAEKRPIGWERFFEERHVIMRTFPPRKRAEIEPNTWRKNLPRKLKRRLKHADAERLTSLLTPELDEYLKNDARGGVYDTLMKKLSHTAHRNNMSLPEGFGLKPVKARPTVLQRLTDAGNFTTLLRVVELSQFTQTLNGSNAVTLFAPTDDAFAQLENGVLEAMMQEPAQLTRLLQHHTTTGFVNARRLRERNGQSLLMQSNASLAVQAPKADAPVSLDGVPLNADIQQPWECYRGLVHTIGKVLMPPPPPAVETENSENSGESEAQKETETQANK